ncbi:carbon starvation protein A [Lachnospiraceae bacterium]|uniref:carbon starvation CstA family protein n=1 Tax=Extibacter sp. GGCC_0201 TaxID=2731209 RepID=UPI001AA0D676|nr:carbon starvation protein A [Extibacter sp. GGCC_0201]MBO1721114.1 carbon starvation protein A [Extibacter sp. GGCC_0201]BDF35446.1 carbon starvation protein A [Lachnospiraceae bacterium]BDF39448.1 carbon starvation protein A [Lachnospiraceae bacterium]
MNGIVVLLAGIAILIIAYVTYGKWLAKQWGVDPSKETPAHTEEDGVDYVPAKAPVLLGHHFSSIAGAGPINGPIQAAVFGWVPVLLWVLIGGIFFGAVHDFGALFASIRHKGQSMGEVIADSMGTKAKKLFITFSYLTLILVVAAFASIVANTFMATYTESGAVDVAASAANARTAMISILFIVIAIVFGLLVYRRNASLGVSTIIGVAAIAVCMAIGFNWHPLYLSNTTWMIIVGIYITVASVTPVWILLQPRDYLSSFLLYFMMAVAVVGIVGSAFTGGATMDIPAFTGFKDTLAPTGASLGYLFPALFVTIACGAISGFHSLVGSGTTAKQLNNERDARPIAYGGMLIECALAIISLCAVGYIWANYASGETVTPTVVFATGISKMVGSIPGLAGTEEVAYSMLVLAVSAFCLTSLDTATRLARYMFQEFWLNPGETIAETTGYKKVLTNPMVATIITVILGVGLGLTGYANVWPLFGAANQLLAALGLLGVATWLGKAGKNNKMFYIPMAFMLVVTITSLCFTIKSNVAGISLGGEGVSWCYVRTIIAVLLVILAVVLAVDGIRTLMKQDKKTA